MQIILYNINVHENDWLAWMNNLTKTFTYFMLPEKV